MSTYMERAILLIVVMLRLLATGVFFYAEGNLSAPFPLVEIDAREYYQLGENLKDHGAFSIREEAPFEPNSNRVPGYPLFIAAVLAVFRSVYAIPILQALIAGVIGVLLYRLGVLLFRRREVGVGAAALWAFDPAGLYYSSLAMSETIFVLLLVAALYVFFRDDHGHIRTAALLGPLVALMVYVRPISMTLPIVFLVAWPFRYRLPWRDVARSALLMVVVPGAMLFPWMLRNKIHFDSWSLSSISSYNFYYSHALRWFMREEYVGEAEAKEIFYERLKTVHPEAPRRRVDISVADAPYLNRLAFQYISQNPLGYGVFHLGTLVPFFLTDGIREPLQAMRLVPKEFLHLRDLYLDRDVSGFVRTVFRGGPLPMLFLLGFMVWSVITALMIFGIGKGWRCRESRLATFLCLAIIAIMAVSSGVVTTVRFRYAITPLIFLLAAYGAYEIIHRYSQLQRARDDRRVAATRHNG